MGTTLVIDALGLWAAGTSESMTEMAVYADSDADFSNGGTTLIATFDVERAQGCRAYRFPTVESRFVHIELLGHGGGDFLRHGEFAVRAANTCPADTNGDGELTPGDFNGWIIAFNNQDPACDQNGDGAGTPGDFNSWILNFNAGCD